MDWTNLVLFCHAALLVESKITLNLLNYINIYVVMYVEGDYF